MYSEQNSYGMIKFQQVGHQTIQKHVDHLLKDGFSIEEKYFDVELIEELKKKLDHVYDIQEKALSKEELAKINELDMCRAPLLYDPIFLELATTPFLISVAENAIQNKVILHLQNGIINHPNKQHHQQSWHRDLPYQNFVSSKPLSISALVTLDPFLEQTGATLVAKRTHQFEIDQISDLDQFEKVVAQASIGSIIFFDSMLYHKAGKNTSNIIRRGINHMYTSPILKQQYDFPRSCKDMKLTDVQKKILGFDFQVPIDDVSWRLMKLQKIKS